MIEWSWKNIINVSVKTCRCHRHYRTIRHIVHTTTLHGYCCIYSRCKISFFFQGNEINKHNPDTHPTTTVSN